MYKEELLSCHGRISPFVHETPVLTSSLINDKIGCEVYFKCENFQRAGAYKIRGATNAILKLTENQRKNGVVTHSSGNFAQAVSLAAKSLGVTSHIVMPTTAPHVKKEGVLAYGGIVYECEPTVEARQSLADQISSDKGATFLHPSNDIDVIIGQGTAAIELLDKQPDLDAIFCPVGGGGLIAGTSLSAKYYGQNCKVLGGEPFEADDAYRSLLSGKIENNETANTIADGLRTTLGDTNFPIIKSNVSKIVRVTEEEIISAMRLVWERMKIIIEPSSAVALAALFRDESENEGNYHNKKIGIIISGGNVDLSNLPF
ncbi:pyridoxal-phosphate dependent enzyme [Maribacter sp. PR1]|uniref:Pyridoxal-phosphate dependent enzyme n=1 Tax=Maribacter cobaltidurans TaxID=1178778 RepID=A0ABU7IRX3_9FLAO|nr:MULTISPECIES: pyridoxal-phosphate dependent enzyme [Maribacter]MDC6388148.1 pyridoxal-phosphate dependent enzyme [Maribacter sp. PR1]MEE1975536.1 pyridoxal-phosphate dependent enzyme [Maribacter cobaltidurans]